jgi:hypothetical protein
MKKVVLGVAIALPLLVPTPSAAQSVTDLLIGCGEVRGLNSAVQFGQFGLWLEYIVSTARTINTCPLTVAVQARVVNVSHSALSDEGLFSATARRQVLIPYPGTWQTDGEHQISFWIIFPGSVPQALTFGLTPTRSLTEIRNMRHDPEYMCYATGGEWDGWDCYLPNSPLIVDTKHDGYALTSVADGVLFDLDADGILDRVAWTAAESDDAFLVMDRNGNGRIDNGTELFGNFTPAYNDNRDITTANGFEALKFLETPSYGPSQPNGVIDAGEASFTRLMLWRDRNHNGISEPDELQPVSASGLLALHTDYKTSSRIDRYGNEFRQRAKGVWADGEFFIYDVWLKRQ